MHWTDPYIGRSYESKSYDCASLVVDVQREVFQREVPDYGERPPRLSERHDAIVDELHERTRRIEAPSEGCAVQLISRGGLRHLGVFCVVGAVPSVLHNIRRHGVILTALKDIGALGWAVEGFSEWKS